MKTEQRKLSKEKNVEGSMFSSFNHGRVVLAWIKSFFHCLTMESSYSLYRQRENNLYKYYSDSFNSFTVAFFC